MRFALLVVLVAAVGACEPKPPKPKTNHYSLVNLWADEPPLIQARCNVAPICARSLINPSRDTGNTISMPRRDI